MGKNAYDRHDGSEEDFKRCLLAVLEFDTKSFCQRWTERVRELVADENANGQQHELPTQTKLADFSCLT